MTTESADPADRQTLFAPGELVDHRFRVKGLVGKGGMGEVYRAEAVETGETVALKIVLPDLLGSEKTRARFENEVQWTRSISHPNVIAIRDFFKVPGSLPGDASIPCLVMEFVEGECLADVLEERGPMPCSEAAPLVRQMASALDAAHQHNIVHRDLKPANVLLVPEDGETRVVLTDFGVARKLSEDSFSASNVILGTPEYLAPEILELESAIPASDIYALGLVFFEMVTGERPFVGENALDALFQRVNEPAPSPRGRVPSLKRTCERVILRCLERRPEDRYARASDLVADLDAGDGDEPGSAIPRLSEEQKVLAGAALFVLLMVGLLVWFYAV
ncbi:MAG: serine/threonine-protein kinase [Acidobacteriota bacterium]